MSGPIRAPSAPQPMPMRPETLRRRGQGTTTGGASAQRILISGLLVPDASIGVHAHEKEIRQRLVIDITLDLGDLAPPRQDRLAETVDYQSVAEAAVRLARDGHVQLVETLADRIASWCLNHDARIRAATVRVAKPDALADAAFVGCEFTRNRS